MDNGKYEDFVTHVKKDLMIFTDEVRAYYPHSSLADRMIAFFNAQNYDYLVTFLKVHEARLMLIRGFPTLYKDMYRLAQGSKLKASFYATALTELLQLFDSAVHREDKLIVPMLDYLEKHQKLETRKMLLRANESHIFRNTSETLSSHYTNEQVRERYKAIIKDILETQSRSSAIQRI